jgi:hypothetical protein
MARQYEPKTPRDPADGRFVDYAGPGRPRGVKKIARELTNDCRECLEFLVNVMRDNVFDGDGVKEKVPIRFRKDAAVELLDRGWGKPTQVIEIDEREVDAAIESTLSALGKTADALH